MTVQLLKTKLYAPPPRGDIVPRTHLVQRLTDGLRGGSSSTLISAPAGYGKTTLATEWLRGVVPPVVWLSLDEADNDLAVFLSYLILAMQQVDSSIGRTVQMALDMAETPPPATLMPSLLNDILATAEPFIVVLDDFHLLRDERVLSAVRLLMGRQLRQLHLVILTREDPPLPLPRLRVRGEMNVLDRRDLAFNGKEAKKFFAQRLASPLSDGAVSILEERTEGWVAGLQMAALSLRHEGNIDEFVRGFEGDDRHVVDYMLHEVMGNQPAQTQDFLLRTAVAERLNARLCATLVTEPPLTDQARLSNQEMLERLEASNLFLVPLDNRREWYRYHHLFGEFLRHRLARELPDIVPELHRRASHWWEDAGHCEEAVDHALAVPDRTLAADIAERHIMGLARIGKYRTCSRLMQRLSVSEIHTRPYLALSCGWAYLGDVKFPEAERMADAGELAFSGHDSVYLKHEGRVVDETEMRGELAAMRAYFEQQKGHLTRSLEYSQQALRLLPNDAHLGRARVMLNMGAVNCRARLFGKADALLEQVQEMTKEIGHKGGMLTMIPLFWRARIRFWWGETEEAIRIQRRALSLEAEASGSIASFAHWGLYRAHYRRNELDIAASCLEKGLEIARVCHHRASITYGMLYQAQLAWRAGELQRAEELLTEVKIRLGPEKNSPVFVSNWAQVRGQLYLAQGDVDGAAQFAEGIGLPTADAVMQAGGTARIPPLRLSAYMHLPRIFLAQGHYDAVLALVGALGETALEIRSPPVMVAADVCEALAWQGTGERTKAMERVTHALDLAAPMDCASPFVESGAPIFRLLRGAIAEGTHSTFCRNLLKAIKSEAGNYIGLGAYAEHTVPRGQPLPEPITRRERQVLRLLVLGLSAREIADQLIISFPTSRTYIRAIYRKLDAHSRDEAIEKAERLDLL